MTFQYRDIDGDRLAVFTAQIPNQGPGVNIKTDPRGCSVPLSRLEEFIAGVRDTGREAAEYGEQPSPLATLEPSEQPRLFHLQRDHDVSGVSGTGRVANGVLWPDGTVSLRWIGARPSTVHWDRLDDAEHVHGHGGATRIVWADEQTDVTRAVILLAAADALDNSERLRGLTDDHMHDVNAAANELRRMADEAAPMVGSFARDGFGADEIAELLDADTARRTTDEQQ